VRENNGTTSLSGRCSELEKLYQTFDSNQRREERIRQQERNSENSSRHRHHWEKKRARNSGN